MRVFQMLTTGVLFLTLFYSFLTLADARAWKPTPHAVIEGYSSIEDKRSQQEFVFLRWNVAETDPNFPPQTVELLSKYMIIAIVHLRVTQLGQMDFQTPVNVSVQREGGKLREPIDRANLLPAAIAYLSVLDAILSKGMGQMGQGIKTFVFDGEDIAACGKGKVWVYYAGERYFYELPFPGCEKLSSASGTQ